MELICLIACEQGEPFGVVLTHHNALRGWYHIQVAGAEVLRMHWEGFVDPWFRLVMDCCVLEDHAHSIGKVMIIVIEAGR